MQLQRTVSLLSLIVENASFRRHVHIFRISPDKESGLLTTPATSVNIGNKMVSYRKQTARQRSGHQIFLPGQGAWIPCQNFPRSSLFTVQNLVDVSSCMRTCRRFQKIWGRWSPALPNLRGMSQCSHKHPPPHVLPFQNSVFLCHAIWA